jgi:hypothetical protein
MGPHPSGFILVVLAGRSQATSDVAEVPGANYRLHRKREEKKKFPAIDAI